MNVKKTVKKAMPTSVFKKIEPYGHLAETALYQAAGGFPAKDLKIIGVTGTNGKTTTCFMIHKMLVTAGINAGLMTTVAYGVGEDLKPQISHMTTVPAKLLLKRLKKMKEQGAEWIVLEATSHALAQFRTWGIKYSIAVMTNLTHEHLDYHGTFENYRKAKLKLFQMTNSNSKGLGLGIINADDDSASYFTAAIDKALTYGIKNGDIKAKKINLAPSGISFQAVSKTHTYHIKCAIPGSFNVYNSLAVVAVGESLNLSPSQIEQGIATLKAVEGRMTRIDEGQNFEVIIDFAHTPDSFEKLFQDLKPVVKGKLIAMFGSAGRRDEAKRAVQGEIAGKYADIVVITEEDDRDVDGKNIMAEIASGAKKTGKKIDNNLFLIHDRQEAIEFCLKLAHAKDMVILLGKGHEKTIERADGEHPWDEIGLTTSLLKKMKKAK